MGKAKARSTDLSAARLKWLQQFYHLQGVMCALQDYLDDRPKQLRRSERKDLIPRIATEYTRGYEFGRAYARAHMPKRRAPE